MAKTHGSSIKDGEQSEARPRQGMTEETTARMGNASRTDAENQGDSSYKDDEWDKDELHDRPRELDLEGQSDRCKQGLIDTLRAH